jgi:hypothetical protein
VQLSTVSSLPLKRRENALETERRGCDPGGSTTEREPNSCKINKDLQRYIATATISEINGNEDPDQDTREDSRTELDSHANMPVVGKFAFIISNTGRIADVKAYAPDYDTMQIPIVDAAVKYECPYDGTTYILVIRNALHVPSMQNNLIPPFMIRGAGIILNDTPKMQVEHPTVDDHSIFFPETKFRIPMSLWGVFSYFLTSKPTTQDMEEPDQVYMLTPSRWDPHQSAYAENEESILDWEGNVIEAKDRQHVLLSDIVEDMVMAASVQISSIEIAAIDRVMGTTSNEEKPHPSYNPVSRAADQVSSILASISHCLDD